MTAWRTGVAASRLFRPTSPSEAACLEFIAAANPATILELLARLEAAEKERDALRNEIAFVKEVEFPRKAQAVADAWEGKCKRLEVERDALRAEVETTENDAAHQKALADSALRVAEGWERKCGELRAALRHEADCVEAAKAEIDALRAKITEMERQEIGFRERCAPSSPTGYSNRFPLYALPGAKGE